ncbi:cupin domain-containing protein [Sulfurivermis fontis]|uniref:cupin domain-containing protein n=1 Tax=Sulfurivermis fontis TaxID=1972068 RepID=UPI000FDCD8BF|nr:cupin domain-containing protein [Sulfurivermis fontis]
MKPLLAATCCLLLLSTAARAQDSAIKTEILAQASRSWDYNRLPAYPDGAPEISVLRVEVAPGAQLPLHRHPVINAGYLLSGALTVVKESGETLHLKAGEAVIKVVNTWHYGKNEGDVPAVIVVLCRHAGNTAQRTQGISRQRRRCGRNAAA